MLPVDAPLEAFAEQIEGLENHAWGTVSDVTEKLVRQWELLPAEYISIILHYAQQPKESVIRNLELFMREVKPALDELTQYAQEPAATDRLRSLTWAPGKRANGEPSGNSAFDRLSGVDALRAALTEKASHSVATSCERGLEADHPTTVLAARQRSEALVERVASLDEPLDFELTAQVQLDDNAQAFVRARHAVVRADQLSVRFQAYTPTQRPCSSASRPPLLRAAIPGKRLLAEVHRRAGGPLEAGLATLGQG